MRDRVRCASQATEDREARLQQRKYRLAAETAEEREARLQSRRDRLVAETADEREAWLQYSVPYYKTGFLIFGHFVDYLQNHACYKHTQYIKMITALY